jgi:hypothetical protein
MNRQVSMQNHWPHKIIGDKVVIRTRDRVCENADELLSSKLCFKIINRCVRDLARRNSPMAKIFDHHVITDEDIQLLVDTLQYTMKIQVDLIPKVLPGAEQFLRDRDLLNQFVEYVYNYWRHFARVIVCDSEGNRFDRRPYQTFNRTVETLTNVVRSTYRDLQENLSGNHPRIYRQVPAGAEIATIALPRDIPYPTPLYKSLNEIAVIRQILIYPPLIFNPPMNKRNGTFEQVDRNPLDGLELKKENWLCYPAKVGPLLIMVYFSLKFAELGFSLCNLFELAEETDILRKPDAAFLFGVPDDEFPELGKGKTVFFDDQKNDMLMAAIPDSDAFGYFGYLKKMILTLHNIVMMKRGRMPFHGALVSLKVRGGEPLTILTMGDTGAGKSESLEAFRQIGAGEIEQITIIADDMGSLVHRADGDVLGYGTETGAFIRLDDLQTGYAFGQIDRTIIMSPDQVNARVVLPVTTYNTIMRGYPIDVVLYANNYTPVPEGNSTIRWFDQPADALKVFRDGTVMSKGTTTTTGLTATYFANVFGPQQYQEVHEKIAKEYFKAFFKNGTRVGELYTQLGISGCEHTGPELAARELLDLAKGKPEK